MSAAVGNTNRALHHGVAQLVSTFLADAGLPAVPRPYAAPRAKLSEALSDEWEHGAGGDVRGLDGLYVNCTSRQDFRPWVDLDRARVGADITGKPVAAFVQWRSGRPVGESLVVLSLADFSKLVGGSPPTS